MQTTEKDIEKITIEFSIPKDILFQLNNNTQDFKYEILKNIAFNLYGKGKITLTRAADIISIDKKAFIKLLSQNNKSLFNWDSEEIDSEFGAIDNILEGIQK